MAYFPFFVDLTGKRGLIVGGGPVALRKAEKLLPYGPKLTVIAPRICSDLASIPGLELHSRPFAPSDLTDDCFFVIAATDDAEQNRSIAQLCLQARIPVNAVDDKDACTFLFPALVQSGPLSIGISTGGASPAAAIWMKEQIRALLPGSFDRILMWLEDQRPVIKQAVAEESTRSTLFAALFSACLEKGEPLSEEEFASVLKQEGGIA